MKVGRNVVVVDGDGSGFDHTLVLVIDTEITVSSPDGDRVFTRWEFSHVPFIRPRGGTLLEELLRGSRALNVKPNLLDIASIGALVRVGSRSLEENLTVLVNTAFGGDVDENGRCNEVEFVLAHLNWRVVKTVIRTDTEGDVAFTLRVGSTVPFVDPILERMVLHRDVAVGAGNIGSVEPIRRAWWLDFDTLDQAKLSLLGRVVVGIGPLCTVPGLPGDAHRGRVGVAVGFVDAHTRAEVFEVDDVVNWSRQDVGEIVPAASKLEGFNAVERALTTGNTVVVVAVNKGVAVVVNSVCTGIFVHHNGLTGSIV